MQYQEIQPYMEQANVPKLIESLLIANQIAEASGPIKFKVIIGPIFK